MHYPDIYLAVTDSTNVAARKAAEARAPHGTGVLADSQSSGRGRLGRSWFSPAGKNLYCSYIVRPALEPEGFPKLTLVAGLAAAECLQEYVARPVQLKWPNDIFISGRKCGGILSESSLESSRPEERFALIGIGINLNSTVADFPLELAGTATSLVIEGAEPCDARLLFQELRPHLLRLITEYETAGFSTILERWRRLDAFAGSEMEWLKPNGDLVRGRNLGPDESGQLLVQSADGRTHRVLSGDLRRAVVRPG